VEGWVERPRCFAGGLGVLCINSSGATPMHEALIRRGSLAAVHAW
jgi:hypothetical protein